MDWDLRYAGGRYQLSGSAIGTRTGAAKERRHGYIAHLEFDKRGGWLEGETAIAAVSRHADLNDLGFLRRNDQLSHWYYLTAYHHRPRGPFQRFNAGFGWELRWNYDGLLLANGVEIPLSADTRNNDWLHLHFGRHFATMNDDDVRRGGPVIRRLAENWVHFQVETDSRRALTFSVRPEYRRHDGGASWQRRLQLSLAWRPAPSVWFYLGPEYLHRLADAQWVDALPNAARPGSVHFVYGRLDSRTVSLTTRTQFSFTPRLGLELYLQPFIALGDYTAFKELVEPQTYDFRPFALAENRDFHRRSLNSNLVLRWEFRPGSMVYAVWSQTRHASLAEVGEEDLELRPLSRLRRSFSDHGDHVFLVKLTYWSMR